MPEWTTTEERRLRNLHADGAQPTGKQLGQHFARHTVAAIRHRAKLMKLRTAPPPRSMADQRLIKARDYLARRGGGLQAYLGAAVPEAAE